MKLGGGKGTYLNPLVTALEQAGYTIARRGTSHFHFTAPGRPRITVPGKIDDIGIAKRIAKIAGVSLCLLFILITSGCSCRETGGSCLCVTGCGSDW